MAETVRVEIPITATDRTASGVTSAQRRLTSLDRSLERTQRQLNRMDGSRCRVDIEAQDSASDRLSNVDDAIQRVSGAEATVEIGVDDAASDVLSSVEDAASELHGEESVVDIEADDTATGVISDVSDGMAELHGEEAVVEISAEDSASATIDEVSDRLDDLSSKASSIDLSGIGSEVTGKAGGFAASQAAQAAAVMGASFGVYDSVSTFAGFESAMSQVQAISGATGNELDKLKEKAEYMGATTKFTATESAEAFNYMAMAGWKTDDMLSGISGIMNLAAASGENLATTSDIVTDALTAFGLTASDATHFSDVMAQASANANTNVSMMGESFKYVAPLAGAMHYSIEDTALALGLMANAGVKSSMSGTALRRAITSLASPTDKALDQFEKYGISLTDSSGKQKQLSEIMGDLRANLGGLSDEEKTAAVTAMFGNQALAGMLAIINASEADWNKLSDAVNNADGASQDMADTMLDNMQGSFTLMQSAIEGVENELGGRMSPYIRQFADSITAAMPSATAAIDSFMDRIDRMTGSDEWENADLFGKVDIAWDTVVAKPFMKWASGKGKNAMSKSLGSLFSEAGKILPGGKEAGAMSWLSAGILGIGTAKLVSGAGSIVEALTPIGGAISSIASAAANAESIGGFFSSIGSMIPTGGKIALAAAGVTAAVAAIKAAIDNYNSLQVTTSLDEHFGNVQLTAQQAAEAAGGILNADYLVNIHLAAGAVDGAEKAREAADEALKANAPLEWKSSVGIELTADEQSGYKENISSFVDAKIEELENESYAMHIHVETFLGNTEEGETLASKIEEWARSDTLEMNGLAEDIKTATETALSDGIISVDEAAAIAALQQKMNSITQRWHEAQAQAQMDWINQEYGSGSGKTLTDESYTALVQSLAEQRESAHQELEADAIDFYSELNAAEDDGRLGPENGLLTAEQYKRLAGQAIRNQKAEDLTNSLDFETNTLNDTYGSKIQENIQKQNEGADEWIEHLVSEADSGLAYLNSALSKGADELNAGNGMSGFGPAKWVSDADQNALNSLWEYSKPDASAMSSLVNEYATAGQQLPETYWNKFNEYMQIGAASGDAEAAMQLQMNQIATSGEQSLIDAINEMDAQGMLTEEMSAMWHNALLALNLTDETVTLDSPELKLNPGEVDYGSVEDWMNHLEGLEAVGTQEIEGELYVNYTVKPGNTLSEIAADNGLSLDQILADNPEITNPDVIDVDQIIRIRASEIQMDTGSIDAALQEGTAAEGDAAPVEVPVDVTAEVVDTDTTAAVTEAHGDIDDAFEETYPTEGSADITFSQTNNAPEIYSLASGEVQGVFDTPIPVSATADIKVDYNILNPTAGITASSNGSTVTASISSGGTFANGGRVDEPQFLVGEDGPEYVIPVGAKRHARGVELWEQAGEELGVSAFADGGVIGSLHSGANPPQEEDFQANPTNTSQETLKALISPNTSAQSVQTSSTPGEVKVEVNLSPVIQIDGSGMDEEKVFEVLKARIKEVADDIGYEVGEMLSQIFQNTPLTSEV